MTHIGIIYLLALVSMILPIVSLLLSYILFQKDRLKASKFFLVVGVVLSLIFIIFFSPVFL